MAYHMLVLALETPLGRSAAKAFAASIRHALDESLPFERLLAAGRRMAARNASESLIERMVREQFRLDLNPFGLCIHAAKTPGAALALHRLHDDVANVGVKTFIGVDGEGATRVVGRVAEAGGDDPIPCRDAHLLAADGILRKFAEGERAILGSREALAGASLLEVADRVGLGAGASRDAAEAFDAEPHLRVDELAARLGCSRRTLHRRMAGDGLSPEMVKRAAMLAKATSRLAGDASLTEIAHSVGYSDLAHMTRAFKAACGIAPSLLLATVRG